MRLLLPALLLPGCAGPITNELFHADAAFLAALPAAERHTVHWEAETVEAVRSPAPLPGGAPDLRADTEAMCTQLNAAVLGMLEFVDTVRAYAPTEREADLRRWGPWSLQEGRAPFLQVEIGRSGVSEYGWAFALSDLKSGPWTPFFTGTHFAGATVAGGDGWFTADAGILADALGEDRQGVVEVDYDNRDGSALVVSFQGWQEPGEAPWDATYLYTEIAAGDRDFQYDTAADLVTGEALEAVAVRTRWTPEGAGRSDARVSGGDLGEVLTLSQCWDAGGTLTWQADSHGLFEDMGDVSTCAFAETALPQE